MKSKLSKPNWQESSSEKFKHLSAREVLEWMEETSLFLSHFYKPGQIRKMHEKKEQEKFNVRRTK